MTLHISSLSRNLAVLSIALIAGTLHADTFEWTGGGANNDWNNGDNWNKTSGASSRLFPNDGTDIAIINQTLTADTVINVPTGTFNFQRIEIGDAGATYQYTISGPGTLRDTHFQGNGAFVATLSVLNDATVEFAGNLHVQQTGHAGRRNIGGTGELLFTGSLTGGQFVAVVSPATLTVQVTDGGQLNPGTLRIAGRVEIDTPTFTTSPVQLYNNGRLVPVGANRAFNSNFSIESMSDTGSFVGGATATNLTVNGTTTITSMNNNVAPARLHVDTSTLTLAGGLVINSGHNLARHPFQLVNQGTFELTGTSVSSQDFSINGVGTMLINNTTGSALGSGNLRLGYASTYGPATTSVTLSGTGSMDGTAFIGAHSQGSTLAPGTDDAGTLTLGNVVFADGGGVIFPELLFNFRPDGSHGHLQVLGDIDILNFTNFRITGLEFLMGPTTLVTYTGSLTGEIFFLEDFLLPEGYEIDYGTGFDSSISIIPEPSTYALLTGFLAVVLLMRRRRAVRT